ncbi:MAG: adenylate/guanylate cyclase domain-containing protein [Micromonosporaceae bacterium]
MTCPVCGTVAVPGARFCHNCGAALPAAATLPATERRVVTVLFGDLSDFTAWAEDLDPERVGAVTDRVLAALAGAVKTFGGHVDKLTGDGIMAVFGAPVAHEDDAERAVRAALAMQRAVRRVLDDERGGGAPLGLRVGLNTGDVVAGIQAALEYTVIGDTVNTAARLADAAAIGAVYAGSATAQATRHVAAWRQLRPLRLKGKREPVEAYELLGPRDAPGTRTGLGDEAPFVGREAELGQVTGRLAGVVDRGEPRVLVLTAEAGLGKTRFAGEVERIAAAFDAGPGPYAAHAGARVLSVRCAAYGERRRLGPLADLVRTAIGLPTEGGPPVTRPVVEERLRRLAQRVARVAAGDRGRGTGTGSDPAPAPRQVRPGQLNAELLVSLLASADTTGEQTPHAHDRGWVSRGRTRDQAHAEAIPEAVADLLSLLAREAPLVVIVDDLHHATAEAVEALSLTLSRLTGPVLVLLLGRPEMVRAAGVMTRLSDAEVLTLPPLRGSDAARLLTAYLNGGRLAQADEDRLLATAQGNPFYLAELVTLLIERGALTAGPSDERGTPQWRLAPGSLGGRLLSRDLAAVLAARIDALPPDARSVLRDAAVVGDTVPAAALQALREGRASRAGRPAAVVAVELERAVEELLNRRMLGAVRGGYAFATRRLRQAAYAGIGKADLAERHARLARWAAVRAAGEWPAAADRGWAGMNPEKLDTFIAEHTERAVALADAVGLRPDAAPRDVVPLGVAALGRAARRALAAGEPGLVVEYVERAARLAGALSPEDRLIQARALLQVGRASEALAYAEKISANAEQAVTRANALLVAGQAHNRLGDPVRARSAWQEALDVATGADLPRERAEAVRRLGMAEYFAGHLGEAATRFGKAYEVAVAAGDRPMQAWALQSLAWVNATRADFVGADAALGRAARLFAELDDPAGRSWLRGATAFTRLLAGRYAEARRLANAFLPFGERVGEVWAVGTLRAVAAYAAAELGDLTEAQREAARAYRHFAEAGDDWGRGFTLVARGVVARGLGQPEQALDLLSDALGYGERAGHPLLVGMARTARGIVALERGDVAAAEADARAALAVVRPNGGADGADVGPRVLLGAARLAAGEPKAAVDLLAPVAQDVNQPSLLFARRQAVVQYAAALLAAGRVDEAVRAARCAVGAPGEDVRSKVAASRVLAEALAAAGDATGARAAAEAAVAAAYATEQVSERAAADALLARIAELN